MKKEIKAKVLLFTITFLFLFSILNTVLILAPSDSTTDASSIDVNLVRNNTRDAGKVLAAIFIGPFQGAMEVIFGQQALGTRGLFFILLFLVIWTVTPYVFPGSSKWMSGTISFVIAILASMAIPDEFLEVILVQYGAMGATMLTVIPFLIITTWSMITPSALGARVIWIFYAFYYLGMYLYKAIFTTASVSGAAESRILYLIAFGIGVAMFFFIKPIREIWSHGKLDALKEKGEERIKKAKAGQDMLIHSADTLGND